MKTRAWSSLLGSGLCVALLGCSAGTSGTGASGVNGNSGSGATGSGAQPNFGTGVGTGATPDIGQTVSMENTDTGGGPGTGCQTGGAVFVPKVPTVMLMVDRSGTMFKDGGNPWGILRDGVLEVVKQMDNDVRFGLLAVTGEQQAGMCPLLDEVAPAAHNYDALAAKYMSLKAPAKGESPGMRGLERAAEILGADTAVEGDKYVLFVTDGEQDYCDDGDFACPTDSVVYHLQALATQGFKTFIFGLPMTSEDAQQQARYPLILQAFADAGMGLPVAPVVPPGGQGPVQIFYNCQGVPNWQAEAAAAKTPAMQPLGAYAAASGGAKVFTPDPTNKDALRDEIAKVLSGVKSCTFDIGGDIKVIQTLLDQAHVYVEGVEVPLDPAGTNGWHMPTPSQIELVGDACTNWRMPQNNKIDWDFPCKILVPK
ncbi:MAG TPA: vWA domain-containing protein [Polyangiaceae bacterium]|nr:vWA domain-containing protein [Polyangiaceae bacterium]